MFILKKTQGILYWSLLCVAVLTACSSKSNNNNGSRGISYRTSPYSGQTGVDPTVVVKVVFDRDMLGTSFTTGSFTLTSSAGNIAGTVTYDGQYKGVSFTPAGTLFYSSTYTANLSATITDQWGNPSPAYSWTFTTRAGGWGTAQLLESDNIGAAVSPHIATDGSGNAMAVWHQTDGSRNNIWSSYYAASTGWGAPLKVEFDDYLDAVDPRVAFDKNGNAIAVWSQMETAATYNNIWTNRYTPGTGWGTAEKIELDDSGPATNPVIAIDGSGNAMAVWRQFYVGYFYIWANHYVVGSGWGTAAMIETTSNGSEPPRLAFDSLGNAIAVWQRFDGAINSIWANRYTAGGSWGTAVVIENEGTYDAKFPELVIDGSGNALAVWYQSDGATNNIWANRYTTGGTWGTPGLIETNNSGDALNPKIAMDKSGNAIAVWYQSDGVRNNIWANRYTTGVGWGTAGLIESDDVGNATLPEIALDVSGNGFAVWSQSDGSRDNILANRYSAGIGWGTAVQIETDNAGNAQLPQIVFDSNNRGIAVWQQSDGTRDNIWVNQY